MATRTDSAHRLRRRGPRLVPFLFLLWGALFCAHESTAQVKRWPQPDSVPALQKVYNVGDDEFIVGVLYNKPMRDAGDTIGVAWAFARWLNASDWIWTNGFDRPGNENLDTVRLRQMDTLAMLALPGERFTGDVKPVNKVGFGKMMELFPFDSVQSPYYEWKFVGVDLDKGSDTVNDWYYKDELLNIYQSDWPWRAYHTRERVYSDPGDAGLIAEHVTVSFDEGSGGTWPGYVAGGYEATRFLEHAYLGRDNALPQFIWIALKGHLDPITLDSTVLNSDTIFMLKLVHALANGKEYLADNGDTLTASGHTEILLDSFAVTKGQLIAGTENLAKYRDISFKTDLRYRFNDTSLKGPLHPLSPSRGTTGSRVLDVKVYWSGKEKAYLRSIMLRDSISELMYGTSQTSVDHRAKILDSARRMLHGLENDSVIDYDAPVRPSILRLDSGHEPGAFSLGPFRAINRYLTDSLVYNGGADSVQAGMIDHSPGSQTHIQHVGAPNVVHIEHGYMDFEGVSFPWSRISTPFTETPSIAEHNGGRLDSLVGPPELKLTRDSIDLYSHTIQRRLYGFNTSSGVDNGHGGLTTHELGQGARVARANGRPLWGVTGTVSTLDFSYPSSNWTTLYDTTIVGTDTTITATDSLKSKNFVARLNHMPEVSELRLATNLVLCYGGRGQTYYWLGSTLNPRHQQIKIFTKGFDGADTLGWGKTRDMSFPGKSFEEVLDGTAGDVIDLVVDSPKLWLSPGPIWTTYDTLTAGYFTDVIPNTWVGWQSRSEGLRTINARSKLIGTEMARRGLRWRDAYSVHHQATMPGSSDEDTTFPGVRPLPNSEIVTGVRAWHPITGRVDSAWATYVELGLFYTKADSSNVHLLDTNHVYVVNRRTFERPSDVSDTTVRGRLMDTLAESRTIELRFKLSNPADSGQYAFIRIREVLPDESDLPIIGQRHPLDTIVSYEDDEFTKVLLTLGPGHGALLELTYLLPDESMLEGTLNRNGQRKIVYDPEKQRYYATYHRYDTGLGGQHVFFRRSVPVDTTGSILWEPIEHVVSDAKGLFDPARTLNSHPSLTYRRMNDTTTIVSIVWTAHPYYSGHTGEREVLLREIEYKEYYDALNQAPVSTGDWTPVKETVAYHKGETAFEWGTPVISSAGFGDYIAWSDSVEGIIARGVLRHPSVFVGLTFTPIDTVSKIWTDTLGVVPVGRYPSMPPFTHRGINDSSSALVWQQPDGYGYTGIVYQRLHYTPPPAGPVITSDHLQGSPLFLSSYDGQSMTYQYLHPSIDQTQDALGRVMEGITYERHFYLLDDWNYEVYFRSVVYDTATRKSFLVGNEIHNLDLSSGSGPDLGFIYPVASSENQVMTLADTSQTPLFDLVMRGAESCTDCMKTLEAKWNPSSGASWVTHTNVWGSPRIRHYAHGGLMPTGSSSDGKLTDRYTTLYANVADSVLRTSRQFFGRVRPGGYNAQGIQITTRVSDSLGLGVAVRLHDVWMSDATKSDDVGMRLPSRPDSLSDLLARLRSNTFSTSDSVDIGLFAYCELFVRDSGLASGERLDYVIELVDSSTGDVVAALDSVTLDVTSRHYAVRLDTTLDLLSGDYYVRGRITSNAFEENRALSDTTFDWSVTQLNQTVASLASKRVRRLDGEAGNGLRLSAQPNPFAEETEIRFSIPRGEPVSLRVFDATGREVAKLIDGEEMEHGRYAAALESANLPNGAYIVELRAGEERITTQVVIQR